MIPRESRHAGAGPVTTATPSARGTARLPRCRQTGPSQTTGLINKTCQPIDFAGRSGRARTCDPRFWSSKVCVLPCGNASHFVMQIRWLDTFSRGAPYQPVMPDSGPYRGRKCPEKCPASHIISARACNVASICRWRFSPLPQDHSHASCPKIIKDNLRPPRRRGLAGDGRPKDIILKQIDRIPFTTLRPLAKAIDV
jgi:hypothetical protein